MNTPDHTPDNIPDNIPDPTPPNSAAPLPRAPWILLDRLTATQSATVLDRIAQWLAGAGEPDAVAACAAACSLEEDDEFSVAAWLDALSARLTHRIAETDSWSGSWGEAGHDWGRDSWS